MRNTSSSPCRPRIPKMSPKLMSVHGGPPARQAPQHALEPRGRERAALVVHEALDAEVLALVGVPSAPPMKTRVLAGLMDELKRQSTRMSHSTAEVATTVAAVRTGVRARA